ncbi:MAG TPA: hypothetical protein VJT09_09330 [Pyrinomonadaceae bacterium]|nr:hypothetical protein [Pyrinomonadaceae bacterium]
MWTDEVVESTRKAREEYAAKFDYDLEAIYEDLKRQEALTERKIVSLPPKKPIFIPEAKAS